MSAIDALIERAEADAAHLKALASAEGVTSAAKALEAEASGLRDLIDRAKQELEELRG